MSEDAYIGYDFGGSDECCATIFHKDTVVLQTFEIAEVEALIAIYSRIERLQDRIAELEAAIRNHKACGGEPVDSERLYAVLQEDKP